MNAGEGERKEKTLPFRASFMSEADAASLFFLF